MTLESSTGTPALIPVLVVEDEWSIASLVAEVVHDAGFAPVVATNGREAMDRAREQWPLLVVTDLMMPHLDGIGLTRELKAEATVNGRAMPPVILTTAAGTRRAREAGADAILRKPFDLEELEALLHRFLG